MNCEACGTVIRDGDELYGSMHRRCVERLLEAQKRRWARIEDS